MTQPSFKSFIKGVENMRRLISFLAIGIGALSAFVFSIPSTATPVYATCTPAWVLTARNDAYAYFYDRNQHKNTYAQITTAVWSANNCGLVRREETIQVNDHSPASSITANVGWTSSPCGPASSSVTHSNNWYSTVYGPNYAMSCGLPCAPGACYYNATNDTYMSPDYSYTELQSGTASDGYAYFQKDNMTLDVTFTIQTNFAIGGPPNYMAPTTTGPG